MVPTPVHLGDLRPGMRVIDADHASTHEDYLVVRPPEEHATGRFRVVTLDGNDVETTFTELDEPCRLWRVR